MRFALEALLFQTAGSRFWAPEPTPEPAIDLCRAPPPGGLPRTSRCRRAAERTPRGSSGSAAPNRERRRARPVARRGVCGRGAGARAARRRGRGLGRPRPGSKRPTSSTHRSRGRWARSPRSSPRRSRPWPCSCSSSRSRVRVPSDIEKRLHAGAFLWLTRCGRACRWASAGRAGECFGWGRGRSRETGARG